MEAQSAKSADVRAWVEDADLSIYVGDAREVLAALPDDAAAACVTSPPYLDARPEYPSPTLSEFEAIFREMRRVVSGPALVNVGRIFRNGCEVRWHEPLLAAAERAGWSHLDTITWVKPNANPIHGNVLADRHEYVFVLGDPGTTLNVDAVRVAYAESSVARLRRGWTNHVGVKNDDSRRRGRRVSEPHPLGGRAPSYIVVDTGREKGNPHPAPMPLNLALDMVALASWPGGTVLDPFAGSGTTALAARRLDRRSVLIELDADYARLAAERLQQLSLLA